MQIAIPKENRPGELRVAASPETVKKFITMGFDVIVEKGAGAGASMADAAYVEAGASLAADGAEACAAADKVGNDACKAPATMQPGKWRGICCSDPDKSRISQGVVQSFCPLL